MPLSTIFQLYCGGQSYFVVENHKHTLPVILWLVMLTHGWSYCYSHQPLVNWQRDPCSHELFISNLIGYAMVWRTSIICINHGLTLPTIKWQVLPELKFPTLKSKEM
jgi:hypothetical protein